MNKLFFILIISILSFSSCGVVKKNLETEDVLNTVNNSKELINKINSKNIDPEWLSLNSKIKINKEEKETIISSQIRVRKDSVIWISVKAPIGIEVFRTMITPDSIYYMSRMNKTYFVKNILQIKEVVKVDFSFIKLQEILFASPNITVFNSDKENYEILKDIFRVSKIYLQEKEDEKVSIIYSDYNDFSELGGLYFPNKIFVDIKSTEAFTAEINYTKIKFHKTSSISFIIPKSYVPIN